MLPQEVAERADVLLESPVGQETAVPGKDLGLRQSGRDAALVRVTKKKLAGLEGRAGARGGHVPDSLDGRRGQSVSIAEVFVRVPQRRDRLQVQSREGGHVGKPRGILLVLPDAALALGDVAGEEDDDGVEVRTGQASHPVVGVVGSRVSEDLRPSCHSLPKLFRKGGQRSLGDTEGPQPVPGEGDGHPPGVCRTARPNDPTGAYLVNDA